jgi:prophage regulatory protein
MLLFQQALMVPLTFNKPQRCTMQSAANQHDHVIKIHEVVSQTSLSKTGIYDAVKSNSFPPPLKLGKRSSGWLQSEVSGWIAERAAARAV